MNPNQPNDTMTRPTAWRLHVVIQATRTGLGLVPLGALWGLAFIQYLPPGQMVATLALAICAWIPEVGDVLVRATRMLSSRRFPWRPALGILGPALLVACLPDKTLYLGDSMQRLGVVAAGTLTDRFPQTMPLDAWLHQTLALALANSLGIALFEVNRIFGAVTVAALGWVSFSFFGPPGLTVRGGSFVALATTLSGVLLASTGSGRCEAGVSLLAVACVAASLRDWFRPSRWPLPEAALVVGLFLHRTMLLLIPLCAVTILRVVRESVRNRHYGLLAERLLGSALLLALGCTLLPRYSSVLTTFDGPRHLAPMGWGPELLKAAVAPLHLLHVANAVLVVAPAVPLLVGLIVSSGGRRRFLPSPALALVFAPWLLFLLFVNPQQGLPRDLVVYAPLGPLAGFVLGRHLALSEPTSENDRLRTGLALALLAAIFPALVLWNSPGNAEVCLERWATDATWFAPAQRADAWSFLGTSAALRGDHAVALVRALRAHELRPDQRSRMEVQFAAARAGDYETVYRVTLTAVSRHEAGPIDWLALAGASHALGDSAAEFEGRRRLRSAGMAGHRRLLESALRHCPELWPDTLSTAQPWLATDKGRTP